MLNKSLYYNNRMINIQTSKKENIQQQKAKTKPVLHFLLLLKVQRNQRGRVEILTFLSAGKQVCASTLAHSNSNAFFWKVLTLPVKSYWMQHISSFLSSDLSVSRTSYGLSLLIQLSLRIRCCRKCFMNTHLSSEFTHELGYILTTINRSFF